MRTQEYFNYLQSLISKGESTPFFNKDATHAAIVFSLLFENASNEVLIAAKDLKGSISGQSNYQNSLINFLNEKENSKVKILVKEYVPSFPIYKFLKFLNIQRPGSVEVRLSKEKFFYDKDEINFCVADKKMYRIETDMLNHQAFGNFNAPEVAEKLENLFNPVFDKAEPIKL